MDLIFLPDPETLVASHQWHTITVPPTGSAGAADVPQIYNFFVMHPTSAATTRTCYNKKMSEAPLTGKDSANIAVPAEIHPLLWDINPLSVTFEHELVLERILEFGDLAEIALLFHNITRETLIRFIFAKGWRKLTYKSYNFWCLYFTLDNAPQHFSRTSEKTLGQTHWR